MAKIETGNENALTCSSHEGNQLDKTHQQSELQTTN